MNGTRASSRKRAPYHLNIPVPEFKFILALAVFILTLTVHFPSSCDRVTTVAETAVSDEQHSRLRSE